jgi:hypothetical protein
MIKLFGRTLMTLLLAMVVVLACSQYAVTLPHSETPGFLMPRSRSDETNPGNAGSLQDDLLDHQVYVPLALKPRVPPTPTETLLPPTQTPTMTPAPPTPTKTPLPPTRTPTVTPVPPTYYVSKAGSNADGKSWATAWNELDQIDWNVIQPGDTILLDGGPTEMVYNTTLAVGQSGTRASPITIALASESGRNGHVVIFGGRSTPLPYCGQVGYPYESEGVRDYGILLNQVSWIVIDGRKWSGLVIHGHDESGIRLYQEWGEYNTYPLCEHITFRGIEIYDNGSARQFGGQWQPDGPGVELSGRHITFEWVMIHDNGQDAFQTGGVIEDITLRQSWLYNTRRNPTSEEAFNYCQHPDGIQIYAGGIQYGLLIEKSIIGPGFMQGVILGQALTPDGVYATMQNVTLRNVLFTKAGSANIMGYPDVKSQGWVIDHVTSHMATECGCGSLIFLEGYGHTVRDSVFWGGDIYLPDGLATSSGNCQWKTTGFRLGQTADPLFTSVNDGDPFSLDDYTLAPNSPCSGKGSSITSVAQLLAESGAAWDRRPGLDSVSVIPNDQRSTVGE